MNFGLVLSYITLVLITLLPGYALVRLFTDGQSFGRLLRWTFLTGFVPVIGPTAYLYMRKRGTKPWTNAKSSS
jgi:hypothetical protein